MSRNLYRIVRRPLQCCRRSPVEPHCVELIEIVRGDDPIMLEFAKREAEAIPGKIPVLGHHLRAARGMLGWPLHQLADTSELSISTLRRMEEDTTDVSKRSCFRAVVALNEGGVRFVLINGSVVGVIMTNDLATACHPP